MISINKLILYRIPNDSFFGIFHRMLKNGPDQARKIPTPLPNCKYTETIWYES